MTPNQLKELEKFHNRWCNDPPGVLRDVEIPAQVMDLLPDVIQAVRDLENCHQQDSLKTKEINILVKENRQLTAERDAALKAWAEMRQLLVESPKPWRATHGAAQQDREWFKRRDHALSTDCGKGYVPKSELDAANAKCAEMRKELAKTVFGDRHGYDQQMHCFSCLSPAPEHHEKCPLLYLLDPKSTSCGKGYHHDDEWKPVVTALGQTLEHLKIMLDIDGRPLDANDRDVLNDAQQAFAHAERITGGAK